MWQVASTGVGLAFLHQLRVVVMLALSARSTLVLIADGARWIRTFFTDSLAALTDKRMILARHAVERADE